MAAVRSFGDWLHQRRKALDLTQAELACQVGCSAITLRKLEAEDRRPSKQIAERLAEILQIPPDERPDFLRFARGDPFAAGSFVAAPPSIALNRAAPPAATLEPAAVEIVQATEAPAPGDPPFMGLRYFDQADADLFFGREALVARLVARLAGLVDTNHQGGRRFLAVVGASGSGKSSIARAGLLPALKPAVGAGGHFAQVDVITPSAHPLENLAASLTCQVESVTATATLMDDLARDSRSLHLFAQRLMSQGAGEPAGGGDHSPLPPGPPAPPLFLLVVDQFEELFTLCRGEPERQAFIDNLMAAAGEPGGPVTVLITLRADFYAHCAPYPDLRDALAQQQEYLGPMTPAELRQAIERPAELGGWAFEPGLVDLILRDVGEEPGALPLLSHALLETWRHRRGRTLTLKSYAEAGRVQGAIATSAEAVLHGLAPDEQAIARSIFLRLTELGEGTQDTRRRVAIAELLPPGTNDPTSGTVARVLKTLSDARLITEDQAGVEVAHEALIREWPTLRGWLSENREGLRLHRRLTEAAQEWDALSREPSELYRGPRLAQTLEWAEWAPHAADLNALEREFLQASQALAEREAAEREAQRQRELAAAQKLAQTERRAAARLQMRNRIITAVGVLAVVIALWAAILASRNGSLATSNAAIASTAQAAARMESARELALSAINKLVVDPQLGLLLALQSVNLAYGVDHTVLPEAAGALHSAVMASHLQLSLPVRSTGDVWQVCFSPDGLRLATLDVDGVVKISDITPDWPAGKDRTLLTSRRFQVGGPIFGLETMAFSPDGARLAVGFGNRLGLWDLATDRVTWEVSEGSYVAAIAFSPDGQVIAAAGASAPVRLHEIDTGRLVGTVGETANTEGLAFSPDGTRLAVTSNEHSQVWSLPQGPSPAGSLPQGPGSAGGVAAGQLLLNLPAHAGWDWSVAYSPDGSRLVTAGTDGLARTWDAATGQPQLVLHADLTFFARFSPDGQRLVTGGTGGLARVWDANTGRELFRRISTASLVYDVAFSPDGTRLAASTSIGTVEVWDAYPDRELTTLFGATGQVFSVAFSPDGRRLVTGGADRRARLWDASTGQELPGLAGRLDVIHSVAFSHDGQRIATASDFGPPKVWDAASGQLLQTLYGHILADWAVAFSPDDTRLAAGSLTGATTIWLLAPSSAGSLAPGSAGEAAAGQELLTLAGTNRSIAESSRARDPAWNSPLYATSSGVAFSPDGARIVTNGNSPVATVWSLPQRPGSAGDSAAGQQLLLLAGHTDVVEAVAYSPDGKWIATASRDGTARVWDAATGKEQLTLAGHTTRVVSVAFSPDGSQVATGSLDGTAKLWDAATGQLLQNLPSQNAGVTSVAFSPDGAELAVASLDGTTRLYELRLDVLLALAQARVTRKLTSQECQQYLHGPCPRN